jgi:2-hydroxycyclohexanecarboxyl-CoA dehydrogenase
MRTTLVTGGASGIGRAVVQRLRDDGHNVAVVDRSPTDDSSGYVADVTDRAQVDAAVTAVRATLGPITVLVNAAGVEGFKKFMSMSFED